MTSAPVNEFAPNLSFQAKAKVNAGMLDKQTDSFQFKMQQAGQNSGPNPQSAQSGTVKMSVKSESFQPEEQQVSANAETKSTKREKSESAKTQDGGQVEENPQDVQTDKVAEKEAEMTKEIAEALGVTEEEVENAMEMLGLTFADLSDQGNMTLLVSNLKEGVDVVSIMTDETLFLQVKELTEMAAKTLEGVAEELGISAEELAKLIEEQANLKQAETETPKMAELEITQSEKTLPMIDATKETEVTEDAAVEETVEDETVVSTESKETTGEQKESETKEDETFFEQSDGQNLHKAQQMRDGAQQLTQQPQNMQQTLENITPSSDALLAQSTRTQEIIDQIAEYVKIHASNEVTEMEIQLNPANLGTVNLQVAAKDGTITAQLTAQNETVRQALESQIVILKENLEQQGLKVDAVEVTVESHEFERNLSQNQEQKEGFFGQEKQGRRKINLEGLSQEELESLSMEMSEAEIIQLDMMNRSGNKVDYMA